MAVRLRFKRLGKRNRPFYRLAAFDKEQKRDGKPLETLGYYNPFETAKTKKFDLDLGRVKYWLSVGAQPSDKVGVILKKHGIDKGGKTAPATPPAAPETPAPAEPGTETKTE